MQFKAVSGLFFVFFGVLFLICMGGSRPFKNITAKKALI